MKEINDIKMYEQKLFSLADKYIEKQLDGNTELVRENFRDMILFIADQTEQLDNADIETLDKWFKTYVRLCVRYNKLPTLQCFSWLIKINLKTLMNWNNQEQELGSSYGSTVEKWFNTCKDFVVDELLNSNYANPNLVFVAETVYGISKMDINLETKSILAAKNLPKLGERQ